MTKQSIEWKVDGMDCANCATSITRFLERKGLEDVYVNFSTREVRFRSGKEDLSLDKIREGIHKLGFTVVEEGKPEPWWTLERKLWISAAFTLPLLVHHLLMMAGWGIPGFGNGGLQALICLPPFAIGFWHFGRSGLASLREGVPNMDVLIFIGGTSAFLYSLAGLFLQDPAYYFFETSATIFTLVLVGNWLEKRAVEQTTTAIGELSQLQVDKARRVMPSGTLVSIEREAIRPGYILQVNEGDKIPADGKVLSGSANVDESMLTGESDPVPKAVNDEVIGASLLLRGNMQMEVTAAGKDTVLSQMIELVKTAQRDKPRIQRLADKISAIFVPVVLTIALLTFGLGFGLFGVPAGKALMNAVAVLVISCPCAMGLATPTAVMVGVGRMARQGILVRGGQTLETFAAIRQMVFDKTGTLTSGKFALKKIDYHGKDPDRVNQLIYQLEKRSSHPIAHSLVEALSDRLNGGERPQLQVEEKKGKGLEGRDPSGNIYRLGASDWVSPNGSSRSGSLLLMENDTLLASIDLEDSLKENARETIRYLKDQGVHCVILSGDRREKTEVIAEKLGIQDVYAQKLPEEKLQIIEGLSRSKPTAMVGDGINDAPALARATLGVSLSNASEVAIQSAQIVLLNGNLSHLRQALGISKLTLSTIKQNLFWAFSYNIVAIPIAALGFLNPMWGALFMAFSDVVVIGNSIRLKYKKLPGSTQAK